MSKTVDLPQVDDGQRDAKGRFAKGNRGGPGNPYAKQTAALRKVLLACVTPEDIRELAGNLLRWANQGNLAAARLLLSYVLGKPPSAADLLPAEGDLPETTEVVDERNPGEASPRGEGATTPAPSANGCVAVDERSPGEASPRLGGAAIRAPSANGSNGEPSPNGDNGAAPLPNGIIGEAPSANREIGRPEPIANGDTGAAPLPNGSFGGVAADQRSFREASARLGAAASSCPLANGEIGGSGPLPNGDDGKRAPLPNGEIGRPEPLPNGAFGPDLEALAAGIGELEQLSLTELSELIELMGRYQTGLSAGPPSSPPPLGP